MSVIGQVHSNVFATTYEPNLRNTRESKVKNDGEHLKDSVALSNLGSAGSSNDVNIVALKKIVENYADVRAERIAEIKPQIENGTYSIDDKVDAIVENVIDEML
ncbi:MAG: flagellar biosynthesis anti-sigma factor FlgM [Chitinivibrionia bacterium]|jgi:anti-sigma28 factor (negative regulator of flagellin synthesis)|nr:flagellar biosynthesis anti-sigma factor FlgM [Chitinivibrionia bacterium]